MTYITRANFQSHPFHLVSPSPWPIYTSSTLFATTLSGVLTFHSFTGALRVLYTSLISVIYSMCLWFRDVINEATYLGNHTLAVQSRINLGVGLFIISEALFFLAVFWSFFHSALSPSVELWAKWPPLGIDSINSNELPLLNTVILLSSGVAVTYSHRSIIQNNRSGALYGLVYTIILAVIFNAFQYIGYTVFSSTVIVDLGAKLLPLLIDFVISFISLLLNTVILLLIFGLIFMYNKDKFTLISEIHPFLSLQIHNLSQLIIKTTLICCTFYFVLILWCTSSIGVEGIICLGFIFYMALVFLVNIISISLRLLLVILILLIMVVFISLPLYFIIYLVTTLCVIYYTFFDVKKNGFIYNIYHENTLYEKNLYGNLTALGLFIYLVFTIFRIYLLVQDPYVFVNGRSSNDFFATVLNSSGGGGGGNPSPNNPPDYSIIGPFTTTNNDPENNLSAITNSNNTSSVSSAPNLIEDPSNNTKKRKAHDMASSIFNLTGSRIPNISASSGSIITTPTTNIPSSINYPFTLPVASAHYSANTAPSTITSAPYSAEKASEVIGTKSIIDLSTAFKQSSAKITYMNYVHRHHPSGSCCITPSDYYRLSHDKAKEKLQVFLRDSLEQCEILKMDFPGGKGINPKNSPYVFSLILNDQAFHYTVDGVNGVCIPDIRRNGDQFGKVYPKEVEIKEVRFLFFPDSAPARQNC